MTKSRLMRSRQASVIGSYRRNPVSDKVYFCLLEKNLRLPAQKSTGEFVAIAPTVGKSSKTEVAARDLVLPRVVSILKNVAHAP